MFYTVYRTTNLVSGRYYFGVHKTGDPYDGYLGSGKYIKAAIAKHGGAAFRKDILFVYPDPEPAFGKEDELVQCYRGLDPLCMNLRRGGSGGFDWINRSGLSGCIQGGKAAVHSLRRFYEEHPEVREQINRESIARIRSNPQWLANTLSAQKKAASTWRGKHHASKTREELSRRKSGKANNQYGKVWVYREGMTKAIPPWSLDEHVAVGWSKGRKERRLKVRARRVSGKMPSKEVLINCRVNGWTYRKMAKEFGVSHPTVMAWVKSVSMS